MGLETTEHTEHTELAAAPQDCQCGFNANYARRTTAPRRDGLRPRGCWLVLLRSVTSTARIFTAKTQREACAMPGGFNATNTRRCVALFVTLGLRPRKANASAKRMHCQNFYREDAKGSTAKSVRDRFTALLRSVCDARWVLRTSCSCARDARF